MSLYVVASLRLSTLRPVQLVSSAATPRTCHSGCQHQLSVSRRLFCLSRMSPFCELISANVAADLFECFSVSVAQPKTCIHDIGRKVNPKEPQVWNRRAGAVFSVKFQMQFVYLSALCEAMCSYSQCEAVRSALCEAVWPFTL